jgi:hypothetical protein
MTGVATAAVKAGSSCTKLGSTTTSAGKKYTCIKSGRKLIWNKGVAVITTKPTASPTPAVAQAPTPTPSATPVQTIAPIPTPTQAPIIEKAPTNFSDLVENYLGIAGVVWKEAQKLSESGQIKSSFLLEIGPNTKIQEGLSDPRVYLERTSRLWSKFDQSTITKVFIFSYPDLAWAQQKNRELGGSWFTPEDLAGSCTSLINCSSFGTSYRGQGQLFVGVPVRSYPLFNLGFVRGNYGHEYTHSVQQAQFATQPSLNGYATLPCWFSEGQPQVPGQALGFQTLSDYKLSRESWFSQPAGALGDYSQESILKFYSLAGVPRDGMCNASIRQRIYDVGYMTVEALASIKGIESTMQVVVGVSQGLTFNQSFEKVYGISWNQAAPILAKVVSHEFSRS